MRTKIEDYKVGTTFYTSCTKMKEDDVTTYNDFGIDRKFAYIFGRKHEQVIDVKCTIIEEDVIVNDLMKSESYDTHSVDYFGHISGFENNDLDISCIFKNIMLYFICFTYGPDKERFFHSDGHDYKEGDRKGMTVRLKVEEI